MPSDQELKFIADENLDTLITAELTRRFDVLDVVKEMRGASDEAILAIVALESRIEYVFGLEFQGSGEIRFPLP